MHKLDEVAAVFCAGGIATYKGVTMKFYSMTYGEIDLEEIPSKLLLFYNERKPYGTPFNLIIGTDSQNRHDTKVVTVIAIVCEGHGGIFFYKKKYLPLIESVREKLHIETGQSLLIATQLLDELARPQYKYFMDEVPMTIHIDAGNSPKGKTANLIDGLVGWVHATGLKCEVKPDSFVASSVADRLSK